jgi:hypothetical protein
MTSLAPVPDNSVVKEPVEVPKDLLSTKVSLQNISVSYRQKSWVSMGLPKTESAAIDGYNGYAKTADNRIFRTCVRGQELFIEADLLPNEKIDVLCIHEENGPALFQFSDWVIDQPERLLPTFILRAADGTTMAHSPMVFWTGIGAAPSSYFTLQEDLDVRKRFYFKTQITAAPLTIEGWIDVFSNQDIVPITIRATFGTVASERLLNKAFGSFLMITGEKPVIDFKKAKGLHDTVFRSDINMWETELSIPRVWWKARVIECFGALLALPPYDQLGLAVSKPGGQERINTLKAREEAPNTGFAHVWEGNWLSFLKVPEVPINEATLVKNAYNALVRRYNNYGDEYNQRDYAQPPNSGQTGSQPDFGASRGELVVTSKQAWALWDYRFSVQAWMLRPYAHKEADGSPVQAKNHPGVKLWNMSIDTRFGTDLLGWPNPIPYNEFWTGSDGQHRTDNLLFAMWLLTRDPSIKATIDDLVQCSLMELKLWTHYDSTRWTSIETPRGWGRPLLSYAHLVSLGYTEILPLLNEMVSTMDRYASMRFIPQTPEHTVRTLSNSGFKYGWVDINGTMIRAWVCWEETIAAMGLYAAYRVTGNLKALELALTIAETTVRHAFFKAPDNRWYACYCVRWDTANPGKPLPDSAYRLTATEAENKDLVVYGMQQWMLPALRILLKEKPASPVAARAKEIVTFFGSRPYDYNDSAWWAVT